jgi:DHA1 family multidrug resistance protein-like MFS transporter
VKEEIRRKSATTNQHSSDTKKEPSDLELGKKSPLKPATAAGLASLSSSRQEPRKEKGERDDLNARHAVEDRIFVRISRDDDPLDPHNWPLLSRCKNIGMLSLLIFVQAWADAAESMANTQASQAFHVGKTTETLSTAMYLFGVGSGSLFAGSMSETVGRNPTYLVSTFCYLFFVAGSALTLTFSGQVVCRYFVGLFSSATLAINGSSVQDQFRPVKRAFIFPIIAWANVARMDQKLPFFKPC